MTSLRNSLKKHRSNLTLEQQHQWSDAIAERVLSYPEFSKAQRLACYIPMGREVCTKKIIEAIWSANKRCYLPVVTDDKLQFVRYSMDDDLVMSEFGFQQPRKQDEMITADALDLVLTPLVGFDNTCNRLGMGAGHYDRTFAFLNCEPRLAKPFMLGLAYEMQKLTQLNANPWDVRLNAVITEETIFEITASQ